MPDDLYRIIKDGNDEFIAQIAHRKFYGVDTGHRVHRVKYDTNWVFFMDFEECSSLAEAEELLKQTIQAKKTQVVGSYDANGERLNEYPKDVR